MANLIHGKQLRPNTLTENLLLISNSPTTGYILSSDGSNGFTWVENTGGVEQLTGGTATSVSSTGTTWQTNVIVDNQSIFVNGSNEITLGDPTTRAIGGGPFTFTEDLTVTGNLTVNGDITYINSENLYVEDNIITLNSNLTGATDQPNPNGGGIEILRGSGATVSLLWDETNDWWAVSNPNGAVTGATPILTTSSIESQDGSIDISTGVGSDADVLNIEVDESNLSNIPNSALTNSSITINLGDQLSGDTSVELGGTLNIGVTGDTYANAGTYNTGTTEIDITGVGANWSDFSIDLSPLFASLSGDTFVNGGSLSGNGAGDHTLILTKNDGGTATTVNGFTDYYVTGSTLTTGDTLELTLNNGDIVSTDLSSLNDGLWSAGTGTNAVALKNFGAQDTSGNGSINAGTYSHTSGEGSAVFGGSINQATGQGSSIFGGSYNTASNTSNYGSVIVGGFNNTATLDGVIIGGSYNAVDGYNTSIGTFSSNVNQNTDYSIIVGGSGSTISDGIGQSVIGGQGNTVGGEGSTHSAVIGGFNNENKAANSAIVGGQNNIIQNNINNVVVLGGNNITGLTSNHVYTPYLNITSATTGTSNYELLVRDITDGEVKVITASGLTSDIYVTGGTVADGTLTLTLNDDTDVVVTGSIVETVTGENGITASTNNGDVTVGIDYSSVLLAIQTDSDKNLTPNSTTGTSADTGISISEDPLGYVKVEVNGVGYWVANGDSERTTADAYFSANGGSTAKAMGAIVTGDVLYWNNNSSFDLDGSDRVDLFYETLQ